MDKVEMNEIPCGIFRSTLGEAVETEKFLLLLYCSNDKSVIGMKLYKGNGIKTLCAVCERDRKSAMTRYAYKTDNGSIQSNDKNISCFLDERFDPMVVQSMRRIETFFVDHSGKPLPTVNSAGIKNCLTRWRMISSLTATDDNFCFSLCTEKTEYIFSIQPQDANIYCGASYNISFDTGMLGGGQYFRIRNYQDNTAPFCGFACDFSYTYSPVDVSDKFLRNECKDGKCTQTAHGIFGGVKRYTDDEIVLQGCGDDEYIYSQNTNAEEVYVSCI